MQPLPEVRLSALAYTMSHWLVRDNDRNMFDLEAPYQRGEVWDTDQKRGLIKSLLMGLPVGNIVVAKNHSGEEVYGRIVDGKQRITALRDWAAGLFDVPGWWFRDEHLATPAARATDVTVSDLSQWGRRMLENRHMPALEFESHIEWYENPDYDRELPRDDRTNRPWLTRNRTEDEAVRAEAAVYLLINFGGVEQSDADRARAEALAVR